MSHWHSSSPDLKEPGPHGPVREAEFAHFVLSQPGVWSVDILDCVPSEGHSTFLVEGGELVQVAKALARVTDVTTHVVRAAPREYGAFRLTVELGGHLDDAAALERLRSVLETADWAALVEIDHGGEHAVPFAAGGFNPVRLDFVQLDTRSAREIAQAAAWLDGLRDA